MADGGLALKELPAETDKPVASTARALLEQVAHQDVEPDGKGGVKIREGVAKDRAISTVDPEMRHGHKSSAGRWDGYKKHVSVELQTELITAVEVSAANVGDGTMGMKLLEQQAEVGLAPAEVVADHQYAAGELREQAQVHGEGTTIVTKAAALPDDGYFHKSESRSTWRRAPLSVRESRWHASGSERVTPPGRCSMPPLAPPANGPRCAYERAAKDGRSASTPASTSSRPLLNGASSRTSRH